LCRCTDRSVEPAPIDERFRADGDDHEGIADPSVQRSYSTPPSPGAQLSDPDPATDVALVRMRQQRPERRQLLDGVHHSDSVRTRWRPAGASTSRISTEPGVTELEPVRQIVKLPPKGDGECPFRGDVGFSS
jgi:hypothetical protein